MGRYRLFILSLMLVSVCVCVCACSLPASLAVLFALPLRGPYVVAYRGGSGFPFLVHLLCLLFLADLLPFFPFPFLLNLPVALGPIPISGLGS